MVWRRPSFWKNVQLSRLIMDIIIEPHYFGNIEYFSKLSKAKNVRFEINEHFVKQTYRNRTVIYGANGPLNLTVPLVRKKGRIALKDAEIDNDQRWKSLHWRSLESSYRSSPYFEYYEHQFKPLFEAEHTHLVDWNIEMIKKVASLLQIEFETDTTEKYDKSSGSFVDLRNTISPKIKHDTKYPEQEYIQVFASKLPFEYNLSILDLLFNEGPNTISFL